MNPALEPVRQAVGERDYMANSDVFSVHCGKNCICIRFVLSQCG